MRRTKIKIELKNVKTNWYCCTFAPNFLHVPTQECILLWAKRILEKERAVFRPQKVLFIALRIKVLVLSVLWMPDKVFFAKIDQTDFLSHLQKRDKKSQFLLTFILFIVFLFHFFASTLPFAKYVCLWMVAPVIKL